ncbi:hypothetical protein SAMN05444162_0149 [Paenibacillaceae bacterium GAS479]|nr:hypothetical protein SAMN05444162_0149 [Paenibacillaceae bacterium GAS479]
MTRKQRIRSCGNLLQLMETAPSDKLREVYRLQYQSTKGGETHHANYRLGLAANDQA